jgi:hypothetical protein
MFLKLLKEIAHLRKEVKNNAIENKRLFALLAQGFSDSPLKNLPSEDEESLILKEASKNLRTLHPDSSLPASPPAHARGNGFYGDIDLVLAERKARKARQ